MIGWLRRNRSDENGGPRWSADPDPTADERRDELLSAYIDDELTAAERTELEARFATDAELRASFEGIQLVRDTLATLEIVRAPRSFAITAPPVRAAQRALGRFDLVARAGAMSAAVAFVAVLAGDLSGSGGTPIVQQEFAISSAGESAASDPDPDAGAVAGGVAAEAASDGAADLAPDADQASATELATDETPEPTLEALAADDEPTVTAAAATAAVSSTEEATSPQPADTGADAPATGDAATGGADSSNNDAPPLPPNTGGAIDPPADSPADATAEDSAGSAEPGTAARALPQLPASPADVERVTEGDDAGTPDAESALSQQTGDTLAVTADATGANLLVEDGGEASGLAIGLGVVTGLLAAVSGLLWWQRRDGATGPV